MASSTVVPELKTSRLSGADGVRAFAALAVIAHHMWQNFNGYAHPDSWLGDLHAVLVKGAAGVSVFFVLSGMLLSYPFWKAYFARERRPRLGHYVKRRAARIMPGFYVALLVSFVVANAYYGDGVQQPLRRLIAGATFTSEFHYVTFFPTDVNGPLWSIGFEVFCYVVMPLLMLGLFALKARGRRIGFGYWLAAFALVIAVNQWVVTTFVPGEDGRGWEFGLVGGAKQWMPDYNPVGFFGHFAIGILAAGVMAAWQVHHGGRRSWWFDLGALGALAGIAALVWLKRQPVELDNTFSLQRQPYWFPTLAVLVGGLLACLCYSRVMGRLADNPFARYTAKVSFGLYIWHHLVMFIVQQEVEPDFVYAGIVDPWRHLEISLLVIVLSYLVATVSWHVVERPVLEGGWSRAAQWIRRRWTRARSRGVQA